jgi:hypothetical protein
LLTNNLEPLMALGLFEPVPGSGVFSNGASVTAAGIAYGDSAGRLTSSVDADGEATLGRLRIGSPTTDEATLAHYDNLTTTAYSFKQDAAGATYVNAKTGQLVRVRVNNSTLLSVGASSATFSSGVPVTISDTTASTTTTTGALVVSGGVGIAGAISCGGGSWSSGGTVTATSGFNCTTGLTVFPVDTTNIRAYRAASAAGSYPFDVSGHMVFQTGQTAVRDFVFAAGLTTAAVVAVHKGDGGLALGGAGSFGSGTGAVVSIANATAVPSTNPSGGGVLYCEGGALKYRGSSGTVTTLGNA